MCFWAISRPLPRARLKEWCRTRLKLAPETNSEAISWPVPGLGQKTSIKDDGMIAATLCYAIVLPGRKSAFRAGFWPDCYRENTEIGPPAGRRPAGEPFSVPSR